MRNVKEIADGIMKKMEIEPHAYASEQFHEEVWTKNNDNERFQRSVERGLAGMLAKYIAENKIPRTRQRMVEKIYKNVWTPTGGMEVTHDMIIFNPDKFDEFLQRFYMEVVENERR